MNRLTSSSAATEQLLGAIDDLVGPAPTASGSIDVSHALAVQPPLHTALFFSGHEHPDDMRGVEPLLSRANIYFIEGTGSVRGVAKRIEDLQVVANMPASVAARSGVVDRLADEICTDDSHELKPIIRGLLGSKAIVATADLGSDHFDLACQVDNAYDTPDDYHGDFGQELGRQMSRATAIAHSQLAREDLVYAQRPKMITQILQAHPELRRRPKLEVVETLGALHTSYYHRMKRAGEDVDYHFPTAGLYLYDFRNQLVREVMFGRPQPSKELIARAYLEDTLHTQLLKSTEKDELNATETTAYLRKVVSSFTLSEITAFYYHDKAEAYSLNDVDAILEAKSLPRLPQTEYELSVVASRLSKARRSE